MPIHLVCECGARVIAPTKRAGQSIRCPKCDGRIQVPGQLAAGEGQPASSLSTAATGPLRKSRLESAITDLMTARQADVIPAPKRVERTEANVENRIEARIDPPQEKLRPKMPSVAPVKEPVVAPVTKPIAYESLPAHPPAPSSAPSLATVAAVVAVKGEPIAPRLEPPATRSMPSKLKTIALDDLPEMEAPGDLKPAVRPIRIVTTTKSAPVEKGWLGAVYGLAILWVVLAFVGIAIAGAESYFYFRAEELWRLERWALFVIAVSAVQIGLAVYLVQMADWIACRSAATLISLVAAAEAMVLAITLFSKRDGGFAKLLELTPHLQSGRALGVALLLTLLSVLLAYATGSVSLAWQREERKLIGKRTV